MVVDEEDKAASADVAKFEGKEMEALNRSLDISNVRLQLDDLRKVADDIQRIAYGLAGTVHAVTVSELILISAALERIADGLEKRIIGSRD